jgi:hypothetical protein
VTERNTSLKSGSVDSVQNAEAKLRHFEALKQKLKYLPSANDDSASASKQRRFPAENRQSRTFALK